MEEKGQLDRLARFFGGTTRGMRAGRDAAQSVDGLDALPPTRPKTREERAREQLVEAKKRERRQFERYLAAREYHFSRLQEQHPEVARYLKALERLTADATVPKKNDCDFDLAELACRHGIDRIAADYDRFTVYERTSEWLQRVGKRKGHPPIPEDEDLFADPFKDTALGELKCALKLR